MTTTTMVDYTQIITIDPAKRSGQPIIRGTRMSVRDVLEYLAGGMTAEEIVEEFPDLTIEDVRACLAFAAATTSTMTPVIDLLRRIHLANVGEPGYKLPEPVTDEEKEAKAMALALGLDLEHDADPGVQALNRLSAGLREAGITYADFMEQLTIEREKTIRRYFPSLIPLLDEVSPDAKTVS